MTIASVYSTYFTRTTIIVIVTLKHICAILVLKTNQDIVNVLATSAQSSGACDKLVVITSAPSNIRTRY
jgi:hypothetical protein